MSVTVSNLVQGPATLYIAPFGTQEPADATSVPASGWSDLGGTTDGTEITINQEYKELEVDQIVDVPGRRLVKRDMQVKTNMAEPTLQNLRYALNGGAVASGGDSYVPANDSSATQPTYMALLIDGFSAEGTARRVIVRKVLSIDNVAFAYKKDSQTVYSVTWGAHYVSNVVEPFHIMDEVA
jgi:hypothetical protein